MDNPDALSLLQMALWLFLCGGGLSLILGFGSKKVSLYTSGIIGMLAGLMGVIGAIRMLFEHFSGQLFLPLLNIPLSTLTLTIDPLAAFFILLICGSAIPLSLYSMGYVQAEYRERPVGILGALYHLFILSMLLVIIAGNALLFLISWECMALLSFCLVIFETTSAASQRAGFRYLLMTHAGTAFILILFLLLWLHSGSFDFSAFAATKESLPAHLKTLLFACALIGFGTKAGIVPLHIWLPEAHPAAPSHVSAIMSGVMIKTAVYAMLRCLFDFLAPIPLSWGLTLLTAGLVTALLGIIYATTEGDLKRMLAYSSIENMGIILLAIGLGLTFQALGYPALSGIAFVAAFLHMLNHALFKSLLFMAAGAVISATHTRLLNNLGGLIHRMPQTAFFFLIGALSICAFPPFNGFIGEWLIYQSLLSTHPLSPKLLRIVLPFVAVVLGLIGALVAATFVKSFSAGFLAVPRSHHAVHAREVSFSMRLGMGIVAALCLLFGVFPNLLFPLLDPVIFHLTGYKTISQSLLTNGSTELPTIALTNVRHLISISPVLIFALLLGFIPVTLGLLRWLGGKTGLRKAETWHCGVTGQPDFEYTSSGFSQPLEVVYSKLQATIDFYDRYFYIPVAENLIRVAHKFKTIQAGSLQLYLVYLFCTLILCLVWIQL